MTTLDLLRDAIKLRRQVSAHYQGQVREFCPHILGTKNGKFHCLVYQFAGTSAKGLIPGSPVNIRCFAVEGLSNLSVRDGAWHTSPLFATSTQTCVDVVDVEVQ
jgi:hypothetical protein